MLAHMQRLYFNIMSIQPYDLAVSHATAVGYGSDAKVIMASSDLNNWMNANEVYNLFTCTAAP